MSTNNIPDVLYIYICLADCRDFTTVNIKRHASASFLFAEQLKSVNESQILSQDGAKHM